MEHAHSTQGQRWAVLVLLFLAGALNYADRTAFSAIFPLLQAELGMTDAQLGAIGTFFLWSYGAMSPLAGVAGDRFSRASLVTFSLFTWSLVTGATAFVTNTPQMFATRIALGLAEALYLPAAMALIAQHFSARLRGRALSVHVIGLQGGFVLGGYIAGYFGDRSGWRTPLILLCAAGLVLAAACHFLLKDRPKEDAEEAPSVAPLPWREGFRILFRVPSFYFLALEAMIISISAWVFAYWMPLYFRETFNLSLTEAGLYGTAALSAGMWVGTVSGGWLSDRVARGGEPRRMLSAAVCYLLAAPFLLCFLWAQSVAVITAAVFVFGVLQSLALSNSPPLWFAVLEPRVWARAVGVMNTMNCLTAGLGIFAAGFFKSSLGLKNLFAGVSVTVVLTAVLLLVCYRRFLVADIARRRQSDPAPGPA